MQFSPGIKNRKSITISECLKAMKLLKNQAPTSSIPKNIELYETQKKFLWCAVNKY